MTIVPQVLDADIAIQHRVWVPYGADMPTNLLIPGTNVPRHGIDQGYLQPPVTTYVFAIYPMHWRNPHTDPITVDEMARTLNDLLLDVPDSTIFKKLDSVLIQGISFEVQGQPDFADWSQDMPVPEYDDVFGGTVHVRRVT